MRKCIIGVFSGYHDGAGRDALKLGYEIARRDAIVLTGGAPDRKLGNTQSGEDGSQVTVAAPRGAVKAERDGATARCIGVCPSRGSLTWHHSKAMKRFVIETGVEGTYRNGINGVTPDVSVVLKGSRGTLAEAAVAWAFNPRRVLLWKSGELLRDRFEYYLPKGEIERYLRNASTGLPNSYRAALSYTPLRSALDAVLNDSPESEDEPETVVDRLIKMAGFVITEVETNFPGLRGAPNSKQRFEELVEDISK